MEIETATGAGKETATEAENKRTRSHCPWRKKVAEWLANWEWGFRRVAVEKANSCRPTTLFRLFCIPLLPWGLVVYMHRWTLTLYTCSTCLVLAFDTVYVTDSWTIVISNKKLITLKKLSIWLLNNFLQTIDRLFRLLYKLHLFPYLFICYYKSRLR